jgi:hypothetical protein
MAVTGFFMWSDLEFFRGVIGPRAPFARRAECTPLVRGAAVIRPQLTGVGAENAAPTIEVVSGIRCPFLCFTSARWPECDELSRLWTAYATASLVKVRIRTYQSCRGR